MTATVASTRAARHIVTRIIVRGELMLDTPACFGSGDADGPTDLMLLRDSVSDAALLTGASLAGALREHVRAREHGYGQGEQAGDLAALLFGGPRGDEDGSQSLAIVHDAVSTPHPTVERRDGVAIDGKTRTAKAGLKYDLELLAAGTTFPLCIEVLIPADDGDNGARAVRLRQALATALSGLEEAPEESAAIGLGMGKSRGFGRCHVAGWKVWTFDLSQPDERLAWLLFERDELRRDGEAIREPVEDSSIAKAIGASIDLDRRHALRVRARFRLDGPLLIRAGQEATGSVPDVSHLRSRRPTHKEPAPVVPGTSMAGVMRSRAERIVAVLGRDRTLVDTLFGYVRPGDGVAGANGVTAIAQASRLIIHESVVSGAPAEIVQQRVMIDRFTGGAFPGALFAEGILVGTDRDYLNLDLELRNPSPEEVGLVLLLLKDLWTGDLPVGGESSIGRGRLRGVSADVTLHDPGQTDPARRRLAWRLADAGEALTVEGSSPLQDYVDALVAGSRVGV